MNETPKASIDIPPPPTVEDMWVNVLDNLTPEQFVNTFEAFDGGAKSHVVSLLISAMRKITEAREEAKRYKQQAETDQLTGIGSRHAKAAWEVEHYRPKENTYMAIAFDLSHFKTLNDTFGHSAGDAALALFAAKLLETFRFKPGISQEDNQRHKYFSDDGLFLRPGGDEFVVVLTIRDDYDVTKITEIMETKIADRLVMGYDELEAYIADDKKDEFVPVTSRYGFAFSDKNLSLEELIDEADQEAKAQTGSR